MSERFILTVAELHLGHIKETFRAGAVIEHDEERQLLIIDGRKFNDTRDLDILKRQVKQTETPGSKQYGRSPWIVPYSQEAQARILGIEPAPEPPRKPRPGEGMEVIQSDEDTHETIDVSHTQVSKRNMEAKEAEREAARNRDRTAKMEVIRGDETVEERIQRLEAEVAQRKAAGKPTDLSAQQELVQLKSKHAMKTPIVQDDTLGQGVSKSEIPLNAGQHLPSREEVAAKDDDAKAQAEARKQQVQKTRAAAGIEEPPSDTAVEPSENAVEQTSAAIEASHGGTGAVEIEGPDAGIFDGAPSPETETEREAELRQANEVLTAENAELRGGMSELMKRMDALEKGAKKPAREAHYTPEERQEQVIRRQIDSQGSLSGAYRAFSSGVTGGR